MTEEPGRGPWREADKSSVPWAEAVDAWVAAADEHLRQRASEFGAVVTYKDLTEHIQDITGIRTRMRVQHLIGKVLGPLADRQAPGEPMLTALVVRTTDHHVSSGYEAAVRRVEGGLPADVQWHASLERLECYRHFGAEVPPGGGEPQLPPKVRTARSKVEPPPAREVCPVCMMRKSMAGTCDCT